MLAHHASAIALASCLAYSASAFAAAGDHSEHAIEQLGDVHFATSCNSDVQARFDRAVALMHSFAFGPSDKAFAEIAAAQPDCAMAYWGLAFGARTNPLIGAPAPAVMKAGAAAIKKAKTAGAKTQRERDFIAALDLYYNDWQKVSHRDRTLAYERAMEQVHQRYPDDPEAAVFYALALNEAIVVLPADKNYTRHLKAARITEQVLEKPADAITHFTRAMGYARLGEAADARSEIAALVALRDELKKRDDVYWAEQVEMQRLATTAWLALLERKSAEAVKMMRVAADLEDRSEKHVAMENRLWPMRELLGEMLVELKQPGQAVKQFQTSLHEARNRMRGYYGAARAAEMAGDQKKAALYYGRLIALTKGADSNRPEIQQAKAFLASR
jgi:tetratricopeptide (TPR) repeat protein